MPIDPVEVEVTSDDTSVVTVAPPTINFTTANWEIPHGITVIPIIDADTDNETTAITLTASSDDPLYDGETSTLPVTIRDNRTVPTAPRILQAKPLSNRVILTWIAPGHNGGSPITTYQYKRDTNAWVSTNSADRRHVVTGLTNGTTYSFQVRARNAAGPGPEGNPATATPNQVPAPTNFRVINATLVGGVYEADSQDVELDWNLPGSAVGNHLTKYWVRPGHDCPEGRDGGRNQTPVDGDCPRLTLYTEYGTGNTGYTDSFATGSHTYVYRIQGYEFDPTPNSGNDRVVGRGKQITVTVPASPPFVPTIPTGLTLSTDAFRIRINLGADWDAITDAPAYIMQTREHDQTFNTDPAGNQSYINAWSGPQLNGDDGNYQHRIAQSARRIMSRNHSDFTKTLDYNTLYYVRVGVCLTVDCDLADVAFTPERSIRTPRDPN